jgi:CHAT domain-containing protein
MTSFRPWLERIAAGMLALSTHAVAWGTPQVRDVLAAATARSASLDQRAVAEIFRGGAEGRSGTAVVIAVAEDGLPLVAKYHSVDDAAVPSGAAVLLHADGAGERYCVAATPLAVGQHGTWRALAGSARGAAVGESAVAAVGDTMAARLAQLAGGETVRSGAVLEIPYDGAILLDGRLCVVRAADAADIPSRGAITAEAREVFRFELPAGQTVTTWSALAGERAELRDGLPPGDYRLEIDGGIGVETIGFTVLEPAARDRIWARADALARLLGSDRDPLVVQVAAESLLAHDPPLLVDAHGLLASLPAGGLTDHLQRLATGVMERLRSPAPAEGARVFVFPAPAPVADAPDDDPRITALRAHVVAGRWDAARPLWHELLTAEDQRTVGIARLCRAMFLAQSCAHLDPVAEEAFLAAWAQLSANGSADDRRRTCINYGNFLLRGATAEIHDHTLRMAVGVPLSLVKSAARVSDGMTALEAAFSLATDDAERATALVGMARSHALLADILSLTVSGGDDGPVVATRTAALSAAAALATAAVEAAPPELHDVRAVASEVLGRVAFRSGDMATAEQATGDALREYLATGSLVGVESTHRTLGLIKAVTTPTEALSHLLVSLEIGDLLRQRMLQDPAGLARAGFLAQRSYVAERIVGLLVALGRPREALLIAERSKARSLGDILAARMAGGATRDVVPQAAVADDPIHEWPAGIAAVEYLVGAESAWIFTVDSRGEVAAMPICGPDGSPQPPAQLVARVQSLLQSLDTLGTRAGRELAKKAAVGQPIAFERDWQGDLAALYEILLPPRSRAALTGASTVVIVPHHVLHYVPFAALVVKPDPDSSANHMPLPEFLVDQPFALVHAPSLTSWRMLRRGDTRRVREAGVMGIVDFLGEAPALEGVARDIDNMREVFGPRLTTVVREGDATEEEAAAMLRRPGLVAMCTHGQKVPDQPLAGFLTCRRGPTGDGKLTVSEVYELDVRADLVILNCCYGGFADRAPLPGDDLFGMQRALLARGSGTVVSGLWDIFDSTAPDLVRGFCTRLDAGSGAATALAETQRDFLARWRAAEPEVMRFLTHPYYWAVFTVSGDDRTTVAAATDVFRSSDPGQPSQNGRPHPQEQ